MRRRTWTNTIQEGIPHCYFSCTTLTSCGLHVAHHASPYHRGGGLSACPARISRNLDCLLVTCYSDSVVATRCSAAASLSYSGGLKNSTVACARAGSDSSLTTLRNC